MSKIFDNLEIITSGDTSNPFLKVGDGSNSFGFIVDPSNGNASLDIPNNFAIGHTNPLSKIHLSGETRIQGTTNDSTSNALQIRNNNGNTYAFFRNDEKVGIRTPEPSDTLHVNGITNEEHSQFRLEKSYTPTSNSDVNGQIGSFAWDANYLYIKTIDGWKRAALNAF